MVKTKKLYNVNLEQELVEKARKKLRLGQSLSPIVNQLLKDWVEGKIEVKNE